MLDVESHHDVVLLNQKILKVLQKAQEEAKAKEEAKDKVVNGGLSTIAEVTEEAAASIAAKPAVALNPVAVKKTVSDSKGQVKQA